MFSDATRGRLFVVGAAALWSVGGIGIKILHQDYGVHGSTIALYRSLFAGLVLLPLVRRSDVAFRPLLWVFVPVNALMLLTFVMSTSSTTAANAIILQYAAPLYVVLFCVLVLKEPGQRRNLIALAMGMAGIGVIFFSSPPEDTFGVALGIASGVGFAAVMILLRLLRSLKAAWLVMVGQLSAAAVLLPIAAVWGGLSIPLAALPVVALFGAVQLGAAYFLFARGVQRISVQEAGLICLLEPVLNPIWVGLGVSEWPSVTTLAGGGLILVGLVWRYMLQPGNGNGIRGMQPQRHDGHDGEHEGAGEAGSLRNE